MKDKRCSLLWNHVRVSTDRPVIPCCIFYYDDVPEGSPELPMIEDGIDAAFHSEFFEQIRNQMLNGEEPYGCKVCFESERVMEERGLDDIDSMRLRFNEIYDVDAEPKVRYMETAFSKHCNLACRMCSETSSSKWFQYKFPNQKPETTVVGSGLEYYDTDLSELSYIKIVGGEPMIDKVHVPFLKSIFEKSNDPSEITLEYHTNGTVKPSEDVIAFWRKVKKVRILFSVDGYGEVNEILRPPHKWDTIVNTIKYFKSIDGVDFTFVSHTTLTIGNVFVLRQLKDFIDEIGMDEISFGIAFEPGHLCILNQTEEKRNEIHDFMKQNYTGMVSNVDGELGLEYVLSMLKQPPPKEYTNEEIIEIERKHTYFKEDFSKLLR